MYPIFKYDRIACMQPTRLAATLPRRSNLGGVLPRQRGNEQADTPRRPGKRSAKVLHVSNQGASAGAEWLDRLLKALGLRDGDAADLITKMTGDNAVNPSVINRWRHGKSLPTLPRLRMLIKAIQPRAAMLNIEVRPLDAYMRFGLLEDADLDQAETPTVYRNSIEIDRRLPEEAQARMRAAVEMVNVAMEAELTKAALPPRRRRSAS